MNTIKGLLLGSAATIVAVAGAQAADLPVKAKPVEYVKVCSTYGAGFFYIPGTQSCMRISGYVRYDLAVNQANAGPQITGSSTTPSGIAWQQRTRDYFDTSGRGSFSFDIRNNTQYGVMRAYFNEYVTTDSEKAAAPALASAYIQLAGFTVGRFISTYATAWDTDIGSYTTYSSTARDTSQTPGIEYRAQFGGGVSAAIEVADPRRNGVIDRADTGLVIGAFASAQPTAASATTVATDFMYHMPDIAGDVRVEQAWGGFHFGALLHEVGVGYAYNNGNGYAALPASMGSGIEYNGAPKTKYGYALNASLNLTQLPTGAGDKFTVSGQYLKGTLNWDDSAVYSTAFSMFGSGNNSGFYNKVAFGYLADAVFDSSALTTGGDSSLHLTTGYEISSGFEHYWIPAVVRTSLYGNWRAVRYDASAANSICTLPNGGSRFGLTAGSVCNPNFNQWDIGSRTAWNITPDLEVSGDVMYNEFDTKNSGSFIPANGASTNVMVAGKPTNVAYQFSNQGAWSFFSRFVRSW
jgi:hypothetical protein